ncbi:ESPR domain-containing protein [Burkholderia ubonensis]
MNKVYRTIWNQRQGIFVVASELDGAHGKGTKPNRWIGVRRMARRGGVR